MIDLCDSPEEWSVKQQFEHQRGGDLVGNIGDTDIEERQLCLNNVPHHHGQLALPVGPLHSLLQLGHHPGVQLASNHLNSGVINDAF